MTMETPNIIFLIEMAEQGGTPEDYQNGTEARAELDQLRAELARMRAALEHYANRENWETGTTLDRDVWTLTENGFDIAIDAMKEE